MKSEHIINGDMLNKVFIRDQDIVSRKIAGELFLVPVKGKLAHMEQIFTLPAIAEYIWDRINGQNSLHEILKDVMAQFDVGQKQAESDIREFVTELLGTGLIRKKSI